MERPSPPSSPPFRKRRISAYLSDVARLEWLLGKSYHAADAPALTLGDLGTLDLSDDAERGSVTSHPAVRICTSAFPVGSIWIAHQREAVGRIADPVAERVLLSRAEETVSLTLLSEAETVFVGALAAGARMDDAAVAASEAQPSFDFGAALVRLAAAGALTRRIPREEEQ